MPALFFLLLLVCVSVWILSEMISPEPFQLFVTKLVLVGFFGGGDQLVHTNSILKGQSTVAQ